MRFATTVAQNAVKVPEARTVTQVSHNKEVDRYSK